MNAISAYRFVVGIVAIAFVLRYILAERRLATLREQAIQEETAKRVGPWADWVAWRQRVIESEFANG